jgi:hypothetical protein
MTRLMAGQLRNHLIADKDKRFFSVPEYLRLIVESLKQPIMWVMLTAHLHVVLRLRLNVAKPQFPLLCSWNAQKQLYFSNRDVKYVVCIDAVDIL